MSSTLTASDRKSLIRLASSLPVGSEERRAILTALGKTGGRMTQYDYGYGRAGAVPFKEFVKVQQALEDAFKAYIGLLEKHSFDKVYPPIARELQKAYDAWDYVDGQSSGGGIQGRVRWDGDRQESGIWD